MPINTRSGAGVRTAGTEAPGALCELDIAEGGGAIARAAPDWRRLIVRGGAATPFQSFTVASAIAEAHVRQGEVPRIITVRRTGRPVLIFPTVVTTLFGLPIVRFFGDPLIQYSDMLAAPDASLEDFDAAWSAAVDPSVACFALFRRVRDDAKVAKLLSQRARETIIQESPLVDLRQPSNLKVRDARELRRLRRRLAERGSVNFQFVGGPPARELLRKALRFKRLWIKKQGLASKVIGNPDWEQAICNFCQDGPGSLTVAALTVGGRVAAVEAAFVDATCWYGFLGAFAPEFARLGPGEVLTAECLAHARATGLSYYDQLPPSQPYKRRQATGAITVRDYAVTLTPVGRLASLMTGIVPEIKSLIDALPADIRRILLSLSRY